MEPWVEAEMSPDRELVELDAAITLETEEVPTESQRLSSSMDLVDADALSGAERSAFEQLKDGCDSFFGTVRQLSERHPTVTAAAALTVSLTAFSACYAGLASENIGTVPLSQHAALVIATCTSMISGWGSLLALIERLGSAPMPKTFADRNEPLN
jgi:hypothetical protein